MNVEKVFKYFSYMGVIGLSTWVITPLIAENTTIFFLIFDGNYSDLFDLTPGAGNGSSIMIFYPIVLPMNCMSSVSSFECVDFWRLSISLSFLRAFSISTISNKLEK